MNKEKNLKQTSNQKCIEFYVDGMHCAACELLIEKKLSKFEGVQKVDAILTNNKVKVWGNFDQNKEELAEELTDLIDEDGYTLKTEKESKKVKWHEFYKALPIAVIVIFLFILLQKVGVLNTLSPESLSYPSIFLIGLIASLSSCMAVVGGLVLSISANYAKEESRAKRAQPMVMFHISRLVGFLLLGGVLGFLGSAFSIINVVSVILAVVFGALVLSFVNTENAVVKLTGSIIVSILTYILFVNILNEQSARFALSLLTGLVMVILGLNLLDIFNFTKKLQLKMPKSLSKTAFNTSNINNKFTPLLLGIASFFLPCGFTQSMQFQALGAGGFAKAAMIMFVFALGTLPVLAGISLASTNLVNSKKDSGVFFKTSGLIVIFFSIVNLLGALAVAGVIDPIFNF